MTVFDLRKWLGPKSGEQQALPPSGGDDPALDGQGYRAATIVREQMALTRDDVIGIPMLDNAVVLWAGLADAAGGAPSWDSFKPLEHPRLLPHLVLSEPSGDRYFCRLVGEIVSKHLPLKVEGEFLDEVIPPLIYAGVAQRLTRALTDVAPNLVEKELVRNSGGESISYTALQLPFPARESSPGRVLSVFSFRVEADPET